MKKEELLKKCQTDVEACLIEMGNQQELLKNLRETGFYDSFAILEAMNKVDELQMKLSQIKEQYQDLAESSTY
jgi:hypothetical protein